MLKSTRSVEFTGAERALVGRPAGPRTRLPDGQNCGIRVPTRKSARRTRDGSSYQGTKALEVGLSPLDDLADDSFDDFDEDEDVDVGDVAPLDGTEGKPVDEASYAVCNRWIASDYPAGG